MRRRQSGGGCRVGGSFGGSLELLNGSLQPGARPQPGMQPRHLLQSGFVEGEALFERFRAQPAVFHREGRELTLTPDFLRPALLTPVGANKNFLLDDDAQDVRVWRRRRWGCG